MKWHDRIDVVLFFFNMLLPSIEADSLRVCGPLYGQSGT